ncbi:hypothetical protein GGS24DRAFT_325821 [Hypoxylon argillaceum]|nr:hypothetical protein GGS24DRAFT_325821 [Hypoxylon argillaceum]
MSRLLTTATLVAAARALAFDGRPARATDAVVPDATFHLPEITAGPNVKDLFKRDTGDQTVLIAPDNTCGYISGRAGAPITCNGDYTCAIVIEESLGRAGCCMGDDCGIRATCYDYSQVYSASVCDDGCLQDTYTLKCTETTASYCNTITYFSGVIDFFCASLDISTPQQLYTTYLGEVTGVSWGTFTITPTASGSGTDSFESATDGSVIFPESSTTDNEFSSGTSTGSSGSSSTGTGSGGSGSGSSSGSSSGSDSSDSTSKKSSTPIAPIVGGVVGGVVGLALIGLGIFFLVRHNKKKTSTSPEQPTIQQTGGAGGMTQPPPPPPGGPGYPPQGQGYTNGAYGQPPYQQPTPPPPQGYYPGQEQKPVGFVGLTPAGVPDRHDSTSPVSQFSDPRHSTQPHSPTSTLNSNWGAQPPPPASPNVPTTVYEAGGNAVGERDYNSNHHGQFHEMA